MKRSRFGNWLLGVMISSGIAVLWLSLLSLVGMWFQQREIDQQQRRRVSWQWQQLVALESGEVAVQTTLNHPIPTQGASTQTVSFQSLDGRSMDSDDSLKVATARVSESGDSLQSQMVMMQRMHSMTPHYYMPSPDQLPVANRVTRFPVGPNEVWFYVRPGGLDESAYFEGHQSRPLQRIGFVGTAGLTPTKPSRETGFQAISKSPLRGATIIGRHAFWNQYTEYNESFMSADESGSEHRSVMLWEADHRRLFEIDFASPHKTRLARDFGDDVPLSLSMHQGHAQYEPNGEPSAVMPPSGLIRFQDRVELVDASWKTTRTVRLPEEARDRKVTIYETTVGPVLMISGPPTLSSNAPVTVSVLWLNDNGEITRRASWQDEPAKLHGDVVVLSAWPIVATHMASLMPASPLFSMLGSTGTWALSSQATARHGTQSGESAAWWQHTKSWLTYLVSGYGQDGWWIVLACGLGGVISVACYWKAERSRGMRGLEFVAWCGLVFFFGPAGLLGYMTHRPRCRVMAK